MDANVTAHIRAHLLEISQGQWRVLKLRAIHSGHVARVFRAHVHERGIEAPFTVFIKIQSLSGALDRQFQSYSREWQFYKSVRQQVLVRTPEAFFLDDAPETAGGILVLEDLSTNFDRGAYREMGPPVESQIQSDQDPSQTQSATRQRDYPLTIHRAAMASLAALHASPISPSKIPFRFEDNVRQLGPINGDEHQLMRETLGSDTADLFVSLGEEIAVEQGDLEPNHLGLIHCDARLGNILPQLGCPIVDWGDYCWGPAAFDLAFYFSAEQLDLNRIGECLTYYLTERQRLLSPYCKLSMDRLMADVRSFLPLVARTPTLLLAQPISATKAHYWRSMLHRTAVLWKALGS